MPITVGVLKKMLKLLKRDLLYFFMDNFSHDDGTRKGMWFLEDRRMVFSAKVFVSPLCEMNILDIKECRKALLHGAKAASVRILWARVPLFMLPYGEKL